MEHTLNLLDKQITVESFDSNLELGLEFLCSLDFIPNSTANKIIEICLLDINRDYQPDWVSDRENDFYTRIRKYFCSAIKNVDENQKEKLAIVLIDLMKKSLQDGNSY
ncbi:MAG: hypothetical protein H0T84_10820 [Tatlockia sp.]|nr:hypothetical protein [Tatlockia sp.]